MCYPEDASYRASRGKQHRRKHESIPRLCNFMYVLRKIGDCRVNKTILRARKLEEVFGASRKELIRAMSLT